MPRMSEDSDISDKKTFINKARVDLKRSVLLGCKQKIKTAIEKGDHALVWEIICNGPEEASGEFKVRFGTAIVRYTINSIDLISMNDALHDYAISNGWDEKQSLEHRKKYLESIKSSVRSASKALTSNHKRPTAPRSDDNHQSGTCHSPTIEPPLQGLKSRIQSPGQGCHPLGVSSYGPYGHARVSHPLSGETPFWNPPKNINRRPAFATN